MKRIALLLTLGLMAACEGGGGLTVLDAGAESPIDATPGRECGMGYHRVTYYPYEGIYCAPTPGEPIDSEPCAGRAVMHWLADGIVQCYPL